MVSAAFGFFAMLYVTLRISWQLSMIALVLSPVLFLLAQNSSRKVRRGYDEIRELDVSAMRVLNEALHRCGRSRPLGRNNFRMSCSVASRA